MNLPNYFLADLPPEALLTGAMLSEGCQTLRRNREHYLAPRPTQNVIGTLVKLGASWMDPAYPLRRFALERSQEQAGLPPGVLARGLDAYFSQFTAENFEALIEQDLGDLRKLDHLAPTPVEKQTGRASMVQPPNFLFHVAAGNLPIPCFSSIVLGLLLKSAQFVKCASGTSFLPRLFAHSIYDLDPKLGACLEVAEWKGGKEEFECVVMEEADCVTATGSDEAIAAIQSRMKAGARFVGYGHKVSIGFVSAGALSHRVAPHSVACAASDVVDWNQLGCLSPHVFYIENGGVLSPEQFAEMLATELERLEQTVPRGAVPAAVSAVISSRRAIYELRARVTGETRQWCSVGSTAWTVVYEVDPRFQFSCLHRFIYVKGVRNLEEALNHADAIRRHISTVGIAAAEEERQTIADQLGRWGASRVCPLGSMQRPPLLWRHDGRPSLGDLVSWTDWER